MERTSRTPLLLCSVALVGFVAFGSRARARAESAGGDVAPATDETWVRGEVVDVHGTPLEGVEVRLMDDFAFSISLTEEESARRSTTGSDGTFDLGHLRGAQVEDWVVDARLPDWRVLACERVPVPGEESTTWRLVMARPGALDVRLVDGDDEPLEGMALTVRPAPSESVRISPEFWGRGRAWDDDPTWGTTDAQGQLHLEELPCGIALELVLASGESVDLEVYDVAEEGRGRRALTAITLAPDEPNAVLAVLETLQAFDGVVRNPDGSPCVNAEVVAHALGVDLLEPQDFSHFGHPFWLRLGRTDSEGRFDHADIPVMGATEYVVVARSQQGLTFGHNEQDFDAATGTRYEASQLVRFGPGERGGRGLELQVQRRLSLTGRLEDPEGLPTYGHVYLVPHSPDPRTRAQWREGKLQLLYVEGAFHFDSLSPGSYDLVVRNRFTGCVTVEGVEAGASEIVVRVPDEPSATLELIVEGAEGSTCYLLNTLLAPGVRPDGTRVLPTEYQGPVSAGFTRRMEATSFDEALPVWEGGLPATQGMWEFEGGRFELDIATGVYAFDVFAADRGRGWYATGTGWVEVGPGEHRVRFELEPAGTFRGRVRGMTEGIDLEVALREQDGTPRSVIHQAESHETLRIPRSGSFRAVAPAGTYELWVGTPEELRTGSPRLRQTIVVDPKRILRVDLQL